MRRFEGKVVVVVGAGSIGPGWGNGKAAAVQFAREGASVVAGDIRLEAADETKAIIQQEGGECIAAAIDVTSEESVKSFFADVLDRHGRIDVLHNNVGLAAVKPTAEVAVEEWDRIFAINLRGMFLTCRAVLPGMVARQSGAIVNVSSIAARRWLGVPYASYDASKAGVIQFTKTLAPTLSCPVSWTRRRSLRPTRILSEGRSK
jgi:NAD(P)-dependent dehydrogenase (short-subunit alcohol dehydrogenase family)